MKCWKQGQTGALIYNLSCGFLIMRLPKLFFMYQLCFSVHVGDILTVVNQITQLYTFLYLLCTNDLLTWINVLRRAWFCVVRDLCGVDSESWARITTQCGKASGRILLPSSWLKEWELAVSPWNTKVTNDIISSYCMLLPLCLVGCSCDLLG